MPYFNSGTTVETFSSMFYKYPVFVKYHLRVKQKLQNEGKKISRDLKFKLEQKQLTH